MVRQTEMCFWWDKSTLKELKHSISLRVVLTVEPVEGRGLGRDCLNPKQHFQRLHTNAAAVVSKLFYENGKIVAFFFLEFSGALQTDLLFQTCY